MKKRKNILILELEKLQHNINLCRNDIKDSQDKNKINSIIILLIFNTCKEQFISGYNLLNSAKGDINNLIIKMINILLIIYKDLII